jgi:PAS domain S-box-containing protein
VSPQIIDLIGYQPEEFIGQNAFKFIHPKDKLILQDLTNNLTISGESINIDLRILHKNGYYIPASLTGTLVKTESNLNIIGVLRDMTERKRIESLMVKQVKQLKNLEQIRTDLINRISHEFNTPLSSIMSGSDLLLTFYEKIIPDKVLDVIDIINQGGYRLKDMIDNLLIAFKIDSNELKAKIERKNIIPLIKLCLKNIVNQASNRGVLLNAELPNELFIECDEELINNVIINILSNAIKNTPSKGEVLVKTINHHNHVDIIFQDTGVGFTKKELTRLFKKFGKIERFGKLMDVDIEGPGLGLFISNELIKLHKGEITVKSKGRNKGSKFTIRLFKK